MRVMRIVFALVAIALGVVLGALNAQPVRVDLGVVQLPATLGVALLLALLCGVLIAGLMLSVSVIVPLRQRLRRATFPVVATIPAAAAAPSLET